MKNKLPKVAFMPIFDNLGDSLPLIEVAKNYRKLGGEAVFIGLEGRYQHKAEDLDFKVVLIKKKSLVKNTQNIDDDSDYCVLSDGRALTKNQYDKKKRENIYKNLFNYTNMDYYISKIDQEIAFFKKEKIDLVFAAYNFTAPISARHLKIPLVILISGVAIPPYFKENHATFPENYENFITKLIPSSIKDRLVNWYILNCKWGVKGYNRLADKYDTPHAKKFLDIIQGDYTLVADDAKLLNLKPTKNYPSKNFVGPILPKEKFKIKNKNVEENIKKHLNRPGKSILLTLGSSGTSEIYLEIINALNGSEYNVISPYNMILKKENLPDLDDNILAVEYVPSMSDLHKKVDISIIHGGRGTVYTSAYAGKPIIGIPMHSEQQHNLDNLVRNGLCIRLSNKYFSKQKLIVEVNKIFKNYEKYLKKAKKLKEKLEKPKGAEKAAKRIIEIIQS